MKLTKNTNIVEKEVVQKVIVDESTFTIELTLEEMKKLKAVLGRICTNSVNSFTSVLFRKLYDLPELHYDNNPYYKGQIQEI